MNDDFDALESELASLTPAAPSSQLRGRIAEQLAAIAPVDRKHTWRLPLAITAAVALAASLLVMLLPQNSTTFVAPAQEFATPPAQAFDPALPSVWSYHRALTGSSAALDSLLNQHAATRSSDEPLSPTTAFRSFTSANQAALGEL